MGFVLGVGAYFFICYWIAVFLWRLATVLLSGAGPDGPGELRVSRKANAWILIVCLAFFGVVCFLSDQSDRQQVDSILASAIVASFLWNRGTDRETVSSATDASNHFQTSEPN